MRNSEALLGGMPTSPVWMSQAAMLAFRKVLMSLVGISSKRDCGIGVAFPISLE